MGFKRLAIILAVVLAASGCGQKGPLVLKQPAKSETPEVMAKEQVKPARSTKPTKPTGKE